MYDWPVDWPTAEESSSVFSKMYEFLNAIYGMKATSNKKVAQIQSCSQYM